MAETILNAAQIDELRRLWICDHVDNRLEWGTAPAASASAAAGATSVAIDGLAANGVLTAGTQFRVFHSSEGDYRTCTLAASVTANGSGAATVTLVSGLSFAVADNDRVFPVVDQASTFNKRAGREYFSDDDIQTHAERALKLWGVTIAQSADPDEALLRAVAARCLRQMVNDPGFAEALYTGDTTNTTQAATEILRRLEKLATDWEAFFVQRPSGFSNAHKVYLKK